MSESGTIAPLPLGRSTISSGLHAATNYHEWVNSWAAPYLSGRILDIGSGTANHLQHLADRDLVSVDIDAAVIAELRERYAQRSNWRFEHVDISLSESIERLGRHSFDTVFSSNVLEHIPDDRAALRNAVELLRPRGRVVLLLPAHELLLGSMDRLAGHLRRYDRQRMLALFDELGIEPVRIRYVNLLGALGWFVNNRLIAHRDLSSPAINSQIALFDRFFVPLLRRLEGDRNLPFGQSILAVGEVAGGSRASR
jgi:SAM-dependent methyltransferase